ncbi:MAG: GNAT family N-acetyltransferase [Parvularculaceae bacterium]
MSWAEPTPFEGRFASLEPLAPEHLAGLIEAVKDGELWRLWYTSIPHPDGMKAEIERRLHLQSEGKMAPFTVFDAAGAIIGMTTYMNIDAHNKRVEIGSTWYAARAQRTSSTPNASSCLLTHAFEKLDCIAVEFRTSFFNQQSRRAIERLGVQNLTACCAASIRHTDGSLRDTCVYRSLQANGRP